MGSSDLQYTTVDAAALADQVGVGNPLKLPGCVAFKRKKTTLCESNRIKIVEIGYEPRELEFFHTFCLRSNLSLVTSTATIFHSS